MILYYAFGGGLGHLTRTLAVIHTLQLHDVAILTHSAFLDQLSLPPDVVVLTPPVNLKTNRAAFQRWLSTQIAQLNPTTIYIDTFPQGIQGEFVPAMFTCPCVYLARYLHWERYRQIAPHLSLHFAQTWLLEPLNPAHQAWIDGASQAVAPLVLSDPPTSLPRWFNAMYAQLQAPLWLLVHSGSTAELRALLTYAEDSALLEGIHPHLGFVTPNSPSEPITLSWTHLPLQPAWPAFPFAQRIFSGVGFNVARQSVPFRAIQRWLPFPRTFDDQWLRARQIRENTWFPYVT